VEFLFQLADRINSVVDDAGQKHRVSPTNFDRIG
jgi:hypothetical protein